MKFHMPHPRKAAEDRRRVRRQQDARVRKAIRRAHLADRTPQTYDAWARDGRPS